MKKLNTEQQAEIIMDFLESEWASLAEKILDLKTIELNRFKQLFVDTWKFFMKEETSDTTVSRKSLPLITAMAGITNLNCYPKGISTYTFDVCIICVKGLLKSIANPDLGYYHFNDGYICCYIYERYESFIHIDCFSEEFDSLAYELWENSGDDEEFVL